MWVGLIVVLLCVLVVLACMCGCFYEIYIISGVGFDMVLLI
jgi:hypothetical protein